MDTSQILFTEGDEKLFIQCVIRPGSAITAELSFTGSAYGARPVLNEDLNKISAGIRRKEDNTYIPFNFDHHIKKMIIDTNLLHTEAGKQYELVLSRFGYGPEVRSALNVPELLQVIDFRVSKFQSIKLNDGKIKTIVDCNLTFNKPTELPAYFHIKGETSDGRSFDAEKFYGFVSAFQRLNHASGFLVDYSRLGTDIISVQWSIIDSVAHDWIEIEFANVKEQYYRFCLFSDAARQWPDGNPQNPGIAPLNINSTGILGSFYAVMPSRHKFRFN